MASTPSIAPSADPALSADSQSRDIDMGHLARQTAGDRGLERDVLGLFRDQCDRMLAIILQPHEGLAGLNAAHTLKGAALGVGAYRVAEAAAVFEQAQPENRGQAIQRLEEAVRDARALIDRLLAAC
ncbi:MAG: Hpt domain-containing protein [Beijerinckiaceae bacterium]